MPLDRLKQQLKPISSRLQVVSLADLGVFVCAIGALTFVLLLPRVAGNQLPDLRSLDTQTRKQEFFAFLEPIVDDVSADVVSERDFIDEIAAELSASISISWSERRKLENLAEYYEVSTDDADLETEVLPSLKRRIDLVPHSLVLIQAAKESGWGTSRFAREGNNLFGQRCYSPDCGMEPAGAGPNPGFNVASFGSVDESVASYVRNLNTHPQYESFRRMRQQLRKDGKELSGTLLAESLLDYSERGEDYVAEIKAMIAQNSLEPND